MSPTAAKALLAVLWVAGCASSRSIERTQHPDGANREEYETRNGERHGRARTWHANGKLASEGMYVAGKREGRFSYFAETGAFERQVLYLHDQEVWSSTDRSERPDRRAVSTQQRRELDASLAPTPAMLPVPWFTSLDRTTLVSRAGVELGLGGPSELGFGSARRLDTFMNYQRGSFGGYAQYSQTSVTAMEGTLNGRRTLEVGGTVFQRGRLSRFGPVTSRIGLLFPVGNDDSDGFVASTAGAFQRPSDAAASIPSTVAVRASSSFIRSSKLFAVQADVGVDLLLGGEPSPLDALVRANLGVGFGSRKAMLSVELTNTSTVTFDRRLHGVGLGAGVRILEAWVSGLLSHTISGDTAVTASVGYAL